MANRQQRRHPGRHGISGSGIFYEAPKPKAIPPKKPGEHRWIAVGSWFVSDADVKNAYDPQYKTFLDSENMFNFGIGCWDCEEPLGVVEYGSKCPAKGED